MAMNRPRNTSGCLFPQYLAGHAGALGDGLEVQISGDGVGGRANGRKQPVEGVALVLHALEPSLALQQLDLPLEQVDPVVEDRL